MAEFEQNVEQQEPAAPPPAPPERESPQRDGPGSGRSDIRKSLEKGFEDQRKAQIPTGREEPEDRGRDRRTGQYTSRARQEAETPEGREPEAPPQEAQEAPETAAPEAWSREAKDAWAELPPHVQQAVLKREQDTVAGVRQLQDRYREIDTALAPRQEVIRQTGHTPGQAVNQLFLWFEALTADAERVKRGIPAQAFPALAQSFGIDPNIAYAAYAQQQQQPQPGQVDPAAVQPQYEGPPKWFTDQMNQWGQALGQKFGSIEQAMQQQGLAKANEVLDIWSKGKPYFEEVRPLMAQLLQAQMVAPLPNGNADLDKTYETACNMDPNVRAKMYAEQQKAADAQRKAKEAAEKKAQQDQADKARRAAVALGPSAPGNQVTPERRKGKSVRESLQEAIEEASGARR
jgi:hypothetical protein